MVVGNLIFILNLLVVTKKSITNSSKNLVFQVNVFVSFILQSCFKYMIMTTIKKKKVYDHDYNRFLLDENMATINTSNFKPLQNLKFHLKRVFFIVIYIFYNFFPTLFNKNMIVLM